MISIRERNQQILQMRQDGFSQREVARKFKLSPSRIWLIERRDAADKAMAERRAKLREQIGAEDDPERMWPVNDLADGLGLTVVTKKRLLDHLEQTGKRKICLRELMAMCSDSPAEGGEYASPPLLKVCGIGVKGFWSVVNGLTNLDMGSRCNEEWRRRLVMVKRNCGITGATPYSSPVS